MITRLSIAFEDLLGSLTVDDDDDDDDWIWFDGFPHRQLSIIDGGTQKSFVVYIKASSPLLQNTEHKNLREKNVTM